MKRKTLTTVAFAMLCTVPAAHAGKQQPVWDPGPISVDCKILTADGMKKAIKTALLTRKWLPKDKAPGVIAGHLVNRTHILDVEIKYTAKDYDINFISGENLLYEVKDGQPMIHRNANLWMQNLDRDIQLQVAGGC
jgi:hypothetical protein